MSYWRSLTLDALPNWGAWGRQDDCRPDPESGSSSIYDMGPSLPDGWADAAVDAIATINVAQAEQLDRAIARLPRQHLEVIRARYYLRDGTVTTMDRDAAVRALMDVLGERGLARLFP